MDDISFFPCTCGYQICRFCWHRIRTDENGLCPACRKQYQEGPAEFKPLTEDELHRIKKERKQKDHQRKQKAAENKRHLANLRVVQKNLVFVIGLSQRLADPDILKKNEYFGRFGKIMKAVINSSHSGSSQRTGAGAATAAGQSASAYITYFRPEDCLHAIQAVNNKLVDGRTLKASLGTTKYCSHFLKGTHCPKPDCMYLHELGEDAASFTKEEMQANKHHDYELKLAEMYLHSTSSGGASSNIPSSSSGTASSASITPPPTSSKRAVLSSTPPQHSSSMPGIPGGTGRKKADQQMPSHSAEHARAPPEPLMPGGDARPGANTQQQQQAAPPTKSLPDSQSFGSGARIVSGGASLTEKIVPALGNCNTNCGSSPPLSSQSRGVPGGSMPSVDGPRLAACPSTAGCTNQSAFSGSVVPPAAETASPVPSSQSVHQDGAAGRNSTLADQRRLKVPLLLPPPPTGDDDDAPAPAVFIPEPDTKLATPTHVPGSVVWQEFDFANDKDLLQGDDDLGFDPWDESSKALADLMAKEQGVVASDLPLHETGGNSSNGSYWPPAALPLTGRLFPSGSRLASVMGGLPQPVPTVGIPSTAAAAAAQQLPPQQSLLMSAAGLPLAQTLMISPLALPDYTAVPNHGRPSAFSFLHRPVAAGAHGFMAGREAGAVAPGVPAASALASDLSSHSDPLNLKDWQEGLKALLPNVPINFAAPPAPSRRPEATPQARHMSSSNHLHKSWSGAERRAEDWTDPAIIMSSAPAEHCSPPHWMKSIQQLADSPVADHAAAPTGSSGAAKLGSRLPFVHSFAAAGTNGWPPMAIHSPPPGFHHNSAAVYRSASAATSQTAHIQRQES